MTAETRSRTELFEGLSPEAALEKLGTSLQTGLTQASVGERIGEYGYNEVPEKKQSPLLNFLKRFWGPTPWMLEITIALSYALQRYVDLAVIALLLAVNAVLGFVQDRQASLAVESLKQRLNISAKVLREGRWSTIPARELVPGDIIRVRSGDFVPADAKIADGSAEVDQSALTGESMAAEKKRGDILYSGSVVRKGEATGVVVSTGVQTYFGRTVRLVRIARPRLYVEQVITGLLKWLLSLVVVLLAIAFGVSYLRGISLLEILPLALVLLVSSVPVALPTMFTVTMALGSRGLAGKGVLVTLLNATQDAAMMDVLCADKTGTITSNRLSVADIIAFDGFTKDDVVLFGALASRRANLDPIDMAFISATEERGIDTNEYARVSFSPFDPSCRRTEAIVRKDGEDFKVMKGAVRMLADLCTLKSCQLPDLEQEMGTFAEKGYRSLAVAVERIGQPAELVGLAALYDAPRPDSAKLIARLRDLGISTKMLTGDSLPVASEVAREAGMKGKIIRMADLKEKERTAPEEATKLIGQGSGFAEIYPEDKYLIVKDLQAMGHVVGMTGDGVNDAPALRQAEVGIAVSNATDIAKSAASVVLTHEGLSEIIELIVTGREIHQRIATWILNKIVKTFEIVPFVVLAFLFTGEYVIGAFEIVLMLFLLDFVTIAIATDRARASPKPESWDIWPLLKMAVLLGVLIVAESSGLLYIGMHYLGLTAGNGLHTFVLDMMIFGGLCTLLVVRERSYFWTSLPSKTLMAAIAGDCIVTVLISVIGIPGLTPIPLTYIALALSWYVAFALIANDLIKVGLLRRFGKSNI